MYSAYKFRKSRMNSKIYQRSDIHLILWYGLSFILLILIAYTKSEYEFLFLALDGLILILGIAGQLDRARLRWRAIREGHYPLTAMGIKDIMTKVQPAVQLYSEEELKGELIEFDEDENGSLTPLQATHIHAILDTFRRLATQGKLALEPSIKLSDYLEASTLPHLPQIENRDQLGLFALRTIPAQRIFLWESDLGVARSSARFRLPTPVKMNRRTLCSQHGLDLFQGGGRDQRSNASILANFYWCHSESTPQKNGRFLIFPPHFLGTPNCEYVTTLNAQGVPCSGLKTLRSIEKNEQILMYTGSTQSMLTIQLRISIGWFIHIIAPAGSLLPWIWLWR